MSARTPKRKLTGDLVWKKKVQDNFKDYLNDLEDKGPFKTWKEFYEYVDSMLNARAVVHHLELLPDHENLDEGEEAMDRFDQAFGPNNPFKVPTDVQRGDLFVDETAAGHRTDGVGIFDVANGQVKFEPLAEEPDDYGTIPSHYRVISDFPRWYWHEDDVDLGEAYWHSRYVWFDPRDIDLEFTEEMIPFDPEMAYHYIPFSFNNIVYAIVWDKLDTRTTLEDLNGLMAYESLEWTNSDTVQQLEAKGIPRSQLLIIP